MCIVYWPVDYATSMNTMGVDAGSRCPSRRTGSQTFFLYERLGISKRGMGVKIMYFRMWSSDVFYICTNISEGSTASIFTAQDERGSIFLRKVGTYLRNYMALHPRNFYFTNDQAVWHEISFGCHITRYSSIVPIFNFLWPTRPTWLLWEFPRWHTKLASLKSVGILYDYKYLICMQLQGT